MLLISGPSCLQLELHGVFRGAAGECMRPAALSFIVKMCNCSFSVPGHPTLGNVWWVVCTVGTCSLCLESWQRVIDTNLPHTEERIRVSHLCYLSTTLFILYCIRRQQWLHCKQ